MNERENIATELQKYIDNNKRVPVKLAKRALQFISPSPEPNSITQDFINLFLLYARTRTYNYFKDTIYFFQVERSGVKYSLERWLDSYFIGLQNGAVDVGDRRTFLNYTANSIVAYTRNLNKPISHYGMGAVTGYIGYLFNHLQSTEDFAKRKSSYGYYNQYLSKQVNRIWDK